MMLPIPSDENDFLMAHVECLVKSYRRLTGQNLIEEAFSKDVAKKLYYAPFFLASHDTRTDPILNYGNQCALDLFEMTWPQFTSTPSRLTAEAPKQEERERLLKTVSEQGFIENYSGIRISRTGKRFQIEQVAIWNVFDAMGENYGQAATFRHWKILDE